MTSKEERKLQEIIKAAKIGNLDPYIKGLSSEETSSAITTINKWQEEIQAQHNRAWYKTEQVSVKEAIEKTEISQIAFITDILFPFLKKKYLEKEKRKQRIRKQ